MLCRLSFDRERKRVTFLIRAQSGAEFPAHDHDDDEESYVLSGDPIFDELVLRAGDYHLARAGERHPVGRTKGGCMLLVTAGGVACFDRFPGIAGERVRQSNSSSRSVSWLT